VMGLKATPKTAEHPRANNVSVTCDTAWPAPSIGFSAARQSDLN
jgi:hypothetical protein